MSTILKALRRLEEEKSQQEQPGLRESVVAPSASTSRKLPRLFVACSILALAVAVFSWWQLREAPLLESPVAAPVASDSPVHSRTAPAVVATSPPPARVRAPVADAVPAPVPSPPVTPPARVREPVAAVDALPRAPEQEVRRAVARVAPPPRPAPVVSEEPVWAQEVAVVMPGAASDPKPAPIPEPASVRPAAPSPKPKANFQRVPMPEVMVVRTLWHPSSDRRSAMVRVDGEDDTRQMVEGDSVGGLVLLKIEPSGVVFAHDGVQIQRRVGQR